MPFSLSCLGLVVVSLKINNCIERKIGLRTVSIYSVLGEKSIIYSQDSWNNKERTKTVANSERHPCRC